MRRGWVILVLAVLLVAGTVGAQQTLMSVGELIKRSAQTDPRDKNNLMQCQGQAIGWLANGVLICATPVAGGGGSETCVTCTRSSATVYTCTGLSSITKVRVNSAWQIATPTPATINEYRVSGSTVTFGYSIDDSCLTTACQVVACGS